MYKSVVEGRGGIVARVVAKSCSDQNPNSVICTFELEYPRFIHSEIMTHRCLTGDTELHFDLPNGTGGDGYSLYKMRIEDFYDKWVNGSKMRKPSRYVEKDLSGIDSDCIYSAKELAKLVGYASPSNIRTNCRNGVMKVINPNKPNSEDYLIKGSVFKQWASSPNSYRQDMSHRLKSMNIRAFDVDSGEVIHTNITDIWFVGEKETYTLKAGNYQITGTHDHPVLTDTGWKNIVDITENDKVVIISNKQMDKSDPNIHRKVGGVWRNTWQNRMRNKLYEEQAGTCSTCGKKSDLEIHHIVPVHKDPSKCFDEDNIVAICKGCHKEFHKEQGWQCGNPLSASYVDVDFVEKTGNVEKVYDLSVSDKNHNFVANGIVVHNCFSRNAMSSRAVPVSKMIEQVRNNPAKPIHWGANQAGMQAEEECKNLIDLGAAGVEFTANEVWCQLAKTVSNYTEAMSEAGYHKQVVNRLLEPFQMMKTVLTATEFDNFFWLRCHSDAQPEIKELADCMYKAYQEAESEVLKVGEWHTPYVEHFRASDGDAQAEYHVDNLSVSIEDALKVSSSCCAQVSYRLLDNSLDKALDIYSRLVDSVPVHASPFEHQANPMSQTEPKDQFDGDHGTTHVDSEGFAWSGNLKGWVQYRQLIKNNVCWDYKPD